MKFSVNKKDLYSIFRVEDENLNSTVAPDLKFEFYKLANEGVENLIVNLSDVKYIDSSGLSSLLIARRIWKELGGNYVITGIDAPVVKKLFEISRLEKVVTILDTIDEAIRFVSMGALQKELNAGGEGTELEEREEDAKE